MKININGKYPVVESYVTIQKKNDGTYLVRDGVLEKEYLATDGYIGYLTKLNGNRNPLSIKGYTKEECTYYYSLARKYHLLRRPGRVRRINKKIIYILYIPEKKINKTSSLAYILNILLYMLCVPIFILGCFSMYQNETIRFIEYKYWWLGSGVGLIVSAVLHEMGHVISVRAYKCGFYEVGIIWSLFMLAAYVMLDTTKVNKKIKKAQIDLSGCEMNILLTGICFLLTASYTVRYSIWNSIFIYTGFQSFIMAISNLILLEGTDGEHVISMLLGRDSIVADVKKYLKNKRRSKAAEVPKKLKKTFFSAKY